MLAWYVLNGDDIAANLFIGRNHLLHTAGIGLDQVIGQQNGEGLIIDKLARAPYGVAEPKRAALASIGHATRVRGYALNLFQLFSLAAFHQDCFQFIGMIEMVFHQVLATARYQDELIDAGFHRLFYRVLD